ncbi:unnamed protein product [Periconia digitata]|uniref:Uncharacterized protein n=1 Tax=Periconia digitata TaxID=1303443 RepID=A0A9W4XEQ9_9PLEO|nr:unnamed protein product [Periconia digitata]
MDLGGRPPNSIWPTTALYGEPPLVPATTYKGPPTSEPELPPPACPQDFIPTASRTFASFEGLLLLENTGMACTTTISKIDPTMQTTTEPQGTSSTSNIVPSNTESSGINSSCALRNESSSDNENIAHLTLCSLNTIQSTASTPPPLTQHPSPNPELSSIMNSTPAPTPINSPGLDWHPPRNNTTIAVAVSVPMVSLALLCLGAYFFFYKRRNRRYYYTQHGSTHNDDSGGHKASTVLPHSTVPGIVGNPGPDNTAYTQKALVVGRLKARDVNEDKPQWTKGGYRKYGDGVARPPPLSPRDAPALRRMASNATSSSKYSQPENSVGNDANWPLKPLPYESV